MFNWRGSRRKASGTVDAQAGPSRSPPTELADSPSTSLAPTPEPRLPSRQPSDEQQPRRADVTTDVRGRQGPLSSKPSWWASRSQPIASSSRPIIPPTPPSTTSQSDDEEDDEPDNKAFADKSFSEEMFARSAPAGGGQRMPALLRRQTERHIPDEALDWLRHTTMPGSYKGKEHERSRVSSLQRRHTVLGHRQIGEADLHAELPEVAARRGPLEAETAAPGLADTLPQEIILQIMRSMHTTRDIQSAMLVSRSWCICAVSTIWSKPSAPSREALTGLIRVLRTCPPPRDLLSAGGQSRIHRSRSSRPPATFPYASFIRRLNFVPLRGSLTNEQLLEFAYCTRVERLTLAGNRSLGTETLVQLLRNMRELVAVDLSGVVATTDQVLATIASTSDRLQGVNITGCPEVSDRGVIALAQGGRLLRRIKLTDCLHLTDKSIIALACQCPLILEYDLQGLDQMTDESMRQIWLNSAHVRELRLNGNAGLTDAGFPRLRDLPTLPTPDSERPAFSLGQHGSHQLSDSESSNSTPAINDSTLPEPSWLTDVVPSLRANPVTRKFEYLRTLDLTGCELLTDVAIDAVISNAPRIRTLTLAKCTSLTDASLEAICRLGKHLHYVHLGHVHQITDAAVTKLVRACTRMRYVDLACCSLLTDMTVFEIATNLPKLRRIGLVKVVNVTDQAIYALIEKNERTSSNVLERVHLSYCDRLSVKAITHLLRTVPHITHLSLTGVSSFRQPEYQRFCRPAPPEFNSHQRAAFCVFSGRGVAELRAYLMAKEASEISPQVGEVGGGGERDARFAGSWSDVDRRAADDSGTGILVYRRRSSSARLVDPGAEYGPDRSPLAATMVSANHHVPSFFGGQPPQAPAWDRYNLLQSPTPTTVEDGRNTIDYLDQMLDRVRMTRDGAEDEAGRRRSRRNR